MEQKKKQIVNSEEPIGISGVFSSVADALSKPPVQTPPSVQTQPVVQQEQAPQQSSFGDLLVGATPALVGLLTGEREAGFGVASEYLDKYGQQKNDLLKERLKQKNDASARRFQLKAVEDPTTGEIKYVQWDTMTGEIKDTDKLAGYRKNVRVDPRTGQLAATGGARGEVAPIVDETGFKDAGAFNVKQEKDVRKIQEGLLKDKEFQRARQGVGASSRAITLLQSNNPVVTEGIKTIFPRMFGEVGNLAVQEQERFSGSSALRSKYDRLFQKYKDGSLTDPDRSDLLEVANVMREYDLKKAREIADAYIQSEQGISGIDAGFVVDPLVPKRSDTSATVRGAKKQQMATEGAVIERVIEGRITTLKRVNGEWREIRKGDIVRE